MRCRQLVVGRRARAVLQLAHAVVDHGDQIFDAVGHRRIDAVADALDVLLLRQRAIVRALELDIGGLGLGNGLRKNFDLFVDAGPAAEERIDGFLEVEQPERQPQIARREHLRLVAEAAAVFVVRVDQEDAKVGPLVENLRQQNGDAVRLADAGGADHGKVLADKLLDVDLRRNSRVLLQRADVARPGVDAVVDQPQLAIAHQHRRLADHRIFGDAALEEGCAGGARLDLADQVQQRGAAAMGILLALRALGDLGDQADDDVAAADDAEEFSDGGARRAAGRRRDQADRDLRAADGEHAAERFAAGARVAAGGVGLGSVIAILSGVAGRTPQVLTYATNLEFPLRRGKDLAA